jgi:hypothetical protein
MLHQIVSIVIHSSLSYPSVESLSRVANASSYIRGSLCVDFKVDGTARELRGRLLDMYYQVLRIHQKNLQIVDIFTPGSLNGTHLDHLHCRDVAAKLSHVS